MKVVHRGWVLASEETIAQVMRLYRRGQIPESIEVFMLTTPLRRALGGIYGSHWRAAVHLLLLAVRNIFNDRWWRLHRFWYLTILRKSDAEYADIICPLDSDEFQQEDRRTP